MASGDFFGFFEKKKLASLKTRALRSGAWFKALQRIDRVLIDLTIKLVDTIRSAKLAKSIALLAEKLENAMGNTLRRHLQDMGTPLAQEISVIAQKLGNYSAKQWATDVSFAFFLAIMHFNHDKGFRT